MTTAIDNMIVAKPAVSVMSVSPQCATRWLAENNTHNRPLRRRTVEKYARDMACGSWALTGEPIKFATDGTLLDGQHRLAAVVKANVTVLLFVARGITAEAQLVMDTGAKRTASDAISLVGRPNSSVLAAASRLALAVDVAQRGEIVHASIDKYSATTSELLDFIDANPEMQTSASFASRYARNTDVAPSVVAYTHWIFSTINVADADAFWIAASEKVGLRVSDPVLAMTNRFAESRRNRESLSKAAQLSIIYRVWNARREHRTLRNVRVNSVNGGLVPIPEPK